MIDRVICRGLSPREALVARGRLPRLGPAALGGRGVRTESLLRTGLNIELNHPQNFERLVLGCMDSYDSNQRGIFQGFSSSTRFTFLCTAQISKFQQNSYYIFLPFFLILGSKFPEICHFSARSSCIFAGISQKCSGNDKMSRFF